jgi:8-oxo-dGTP pyrophosphatase MutT (NUDIX family)
MSESTAETTLTRLNADARERKWPLIRPVDAATMILVDRSGTKPKLVMGKRHPGLKFMPGKFVFPGGRVDPADRRMAVCGVLPEPCEDRLALRVPRPSPMRGRALALAAIRETFEETGFMIGEAGLGTPEARDAVWQDFATAGVFPDLDKLTFVARAITPPRRPKRFDTRFFLADMTSVAHVKPNVVGPDSELVEMVHVGFDEARKLDLPAITHAVIDEVERRMAAGFGPHLPVPFFHEVRGKFIRDLL